MAISKVTARRVALEFVIREMQLVQSNGLRERLPEQSWSEEEAKLVSEQLTKIVRELRRQALDAEDEEDEQFGA